MSAIARLDTRDAEFEQRLARLLAFEMAQDPAVDRVVAEIIDAVRNRGDAAVLEYTRHFDAWRRRASLNWRFARDLVAARARIELSNSTRWSRRQIEFAAITSTSGAIVELHGGRRNGAGSACNTARSRRRVRAGGKASYPSTVLMNVIPAKVAGVDEIIMTVPTRAASAMISSWPQLHSPARPRVRDRWRSGGGCARLRNGERAGSRQDRRSGQCLCGAAKRRVFGVVGIDMVAGPSEILIVCDSTNDPIGSRWTCSRRLNTTRLHRPSPSVGMRVSSIGSPQASTGFCHDVAARRDRSLARRPGALIAARDAQRHARW